MDKQLYGDLLSDSDVIKVMGDLAVCYFRAANDASVIEFQFKYKSPFDNFPPNPRISLRCFPFKNYNSDKPPIKITDDKKIMVNAENYYYAMVFELKLYKEKMASVVLSGYPEMAREYITPEEKSGIKIKLEE